MVDYSFMLRTITAQKVSSFFLVFFGGGEEPLWKADHHHRWFWAWSPTSASNVLWWFSQFWGPMVKDGYQNLKKVQWDFFSPTDSFTVVREVSKFETHLVSSKIAPDQTPEWSDTALNLFASTAAPSSLDKTNLFEGLNTSRRILCKHWMLSR